MAPWDQVQRWWTRIFSPRRETSGRIAGTAGALVGPEYPPLNAMSTLARFPWIVICVRARAGDLAGLPLIAVERDDTLERILPEHPTARLFRRPGSGTGLQLRRQLNADFSLCGNAYIERPSTLLIERMHPNLIRAEVDSYSGRRVGWRYGERRVPLNRVLHIADINWSDSLSMIYGESVVRALHDDLDTLMKASSMASKTAGRGRIEMLLHPTEAAAEIEDPDSIREIENQFERHAREGRGLFILGKAFGATPLNLTPRDIEWMGLRHDVRDTTLALFEVPPARAGLATANYGTQKQQMRTYWEALLGGQGALFEDEFSSLTGDDQIRMVHDRTNIEALQVSYTERQTRAERWVTIFGADAAAAASYEGFTNAPVGNATGRSSRPIDRQPEEPQGDRGLAGALHAYLQAAAERYQARILEADGDLEAVRALDEESIRVAVELERAGLPADAALTWGADIALVADEAAMGVASEAWADGVVRIGLGAMAAFGPDRAHELARAIGGDLEDYRRAA